MKCLKIVAPYQIEMEEIQEENITLSSEMLKIRVDRVSLCGSDVKLYKGGYSGPCRYPMIFGHEWSGEVIGIPDGEEEFQIGDHVTGDCSMWCGECSNCIEDKNLCKNIEKFGITIDGYSREVVIANRKYIYKSEHNLPHKVLALTECFAVSLHALKCADISKLDKDTKILVIGCGAIGVAAYMFLRYYFNFTNVQVMEKNQERLKTVQKIIEDLEVVEENEEEEENNYSNVYGGETYQYIFDATGSTKGLESAIELASPLGKISYVGMDGNDSLKNTKYITMKRLTIQGSIGGTGEFPEVIEFFDKYEEMVSKVVTYEVNCNNAKKAFEEMSNAHSNLKCQILF